MIECLKNIKLNIKEDNNLKYLIIVLDELIKLINENNRPDKYLISSHLSAVRHCLRFYIGKCELSESLNSYIIKPERIIDHTSSSHRDGSAIQPSHDDFEQEHRMVEEQLYLDNLFGNFLFECWAQLIRDKRPSKKFFLSYAWPKPHDDPQHESWVKEYLAKLVEHFIQCGMQVYIDQVHSGPGKSLGKFMGKIEDADEIDHVFVVSSRTLPGKLANPQSGCSCEHEKLQERIEKERSHRFIIPVLLNLKNYLPADFQKIASLSFCNDSYLTNFKALFRIAYNVGDRFMQFIDGKIKAYRLGLDVYIAQGLKDKYSSPEVANIHYLLYQDSTPISESFINLAVIKEEEHKEKEKELEKINNGFRDERMSSFEDIHRPKELVELDQIWEPDREGENRFSRVLVEGRAGIGKTTFLQFIANQSVLPITERKITWLDQYDVVIWLPLKRLHEYSEMIDLATFIHSECLSHEYQRKLSVDMIRINLVDNSHIKILYLLDGLDEVSSLLNDKRSSPYILLQDLLRKEHWLLTSRPYQVDPAQLGKFRHLENIGFLDEDIDKYIEKFFINRKSLTDEERKKKISSLKQMLTTNPNIRSISHIPINLELICTIWQEEELDLEEEIAHITMTQLYEKMLVLLLKRYLLRLQEVSPSKPEEDIADLSEEEILVHEKCQPLLDFLSELAWLAMQSQSLIISSKTIRPLFLKYFPAGAKDKVSIENLFKHLFILKPTGEAKRSALDQNYYFVHLTFQEFFAARYWVTNDMENCDLITAIFDPRFQIFWWFVAGLLRNKPESLQHHFQSILFGEPRDILQQSEIALIIHSIEESRVSIEQVPEIEVILDEVGDWLWEGLRFFSYMPISYNGKFIKHRPSLLVAMASCPYFFNAINGRNIILKRLTTLKYSEIDIDAFLHFKEVLLPEDITKIIDFLLDIIKRGKSSDKEYDVYHSIRMLTGLLDVISLDDAIKIREIVTTIRESFSHFDGRDYDPLLEGLKSRFFPEKEKSSKEETSNIKLNCLHVRGPHEPDAQSEYNSLRYRLLNKNRNNFSNRFFNSEKYSIFSERGNHSLILKRIIDRLLSTIVEEEIESSEADEKKELKTDNFFETLSYRHSLPERKPSENFKKIWAITKKIRDAYPEDSFFHHYTFIDEFKLLKILWNELSFTHQSIVLDYLLEVLNLHLTGPEPLYSYLSQSSPDYNLLLRLIKFLCKISKEITDDQRVSRIKNEFIGYFYEPRRNPDSACKIAFGVANALNKTGHQFSSTERSHLANCLLKLINEERSYGWGNYLPTEQIKKLWFLFLEEDREKIIETLLVAMISDCKRQQSSQQGYFSIIKLSRSFIIFRNIQDYLSVIHYTKIVKTLFDLLNHPELIFSTIENLGFDNLIQFLSDKDRLRLQKSLLHALQHPLIDIGKLAEFLGQLSLILPKENKINTYEALCQAWRNSPWNFSRDYRKIIETFKILGLGYLFKALLHPPKANPKTKLALAEVIVQHCTDTASPLYFYQEHLYWYENGHKECIKVTHPKKVSKLIYTLRKAFPKFPRPSFFDCESSDEENEDKDMPLPPLPTHKELMQKFHATGYTVPEAIIKLAGIDQEQTATSCYGADAETTCFKLTIRGDELKILEQYFNLHTDRYRFFNKIESAHKPKSKKHNSKKMSFISSNEPWEKEPYKKHKVKITVDTRVLAEEVLKAIEKIPRKKIATPMTPLIQAKPHLLPTKNTVFHFFEEDKREFNQQICSELNRISGIEWYSVNNYFFSTEQTPSHLSYLRKHFYNSQKVKCHIKNTRLCIPRDNIRLHVLSEIPNVITQQSALNSSIK